MPQPSPPALAANLGPVLQARQNPVGALLFDTAADSRGSDPVARFLAEDAPALDWQHDFLRSEALDLIIELPREGREIDESELEVYSKSDLVTTGEAAAADDSAS